MSSHSSFDNYSAGRPKATDSIDTFKEICQTQGHSQGGPTPSILPGSGLNSKTLPPFLKELYSGSDSFSEVHCSCGTWINPHQIPADEIERIKYKGLGFSATAETTCLVWETLGEEVLKVRRILDGFVCDM